MNSTRLGCACRGSSSFKNTLVCFYLGHQVTTLVEGCSDFYLVTESQDSRRTTIKKAVIKITTLHYAKLLGRLNEKKRTMKERRLRVKERKAPPRLPVPSLPVPSTVHHRELSLVMMMTPLHVSMYVITTPEPPSGHRLRHVRHAAAHVRDGLGVRVGPGTALDPTATVRAANGARTRKAAWERRLGRHRHGTRASGGGHDNDGSTVGPRRAAARRPGLHQ